MVRFIRWTLIAAAVLVAVLDLAGNYRFPYTPYTGLRHSNLVFHDIEDLSPNEGLPLERGDRIVAVDGEKVRNLNHYRYITERKGTGSRPYTFARGDSLFRVEVESVLQPTEKVYRRISYSLTAFTFIVLSLIVVMRRPDILGILFGINCVIIAFIFTGRPVTGVPIVHLAGELVYDLLLVFFPAFFLHFFMIFPGKEIEEGTRRSLVRRFLYIPPVLIFLALFVTAMLRYSSGVEESLLQVLNGVTSIYWMVYVLGSVVVFTRTYIVSDKVQRVKFRIATIGLVLGVLPVSAVMFVRQFMPSVELPFADASVLFLSFVSASFAYAILRHDAFDLRFVYGVGLVLVLVPAVLAAALFAYGGYMGDVKYYFLIFSGLIVFMIAYLPARGVLRKIAEWTIFRDRKAFRERVVDFSRKIRSMETVEDVTSFVAGSMRELSGASSVHVFLAAGESKYKLSSCSPEDSSIAFTSFPAGAGLVGLARRRRSPLMVEYYDRIWINNNLDRTSREMLALSKASVIVPLAGQEDLLGFVILGRKENGKPYSSVDAEILDILGERSAAAVRNSLLYRDSMEKKKLEEEVRLASEIQSRLLPSAPPRVEGVSILGEIRTSREVGGDLYDYLELAPGVVGFAVADVSGKGIPASILMTTLQAGFRAEASADRTPAEVLSSLNRTLFEKSELSRFATFFYGIYDSTSGILRYSNGGAFPPVLLREDGSISRLTRGGTLIGVDPESQYADGVLKMTAGDLLVSYTDGFIDQENVSSGEYYGEERLIEFLRSNRDLPVLDLMRKLFDTVLSFGDGLRKDDMTAVMLRVERTPPE